MGRGVPHGGPGCARSRRDVNGAARRAFVLANTAIHAVPHAPEIRLHVADEAVALWQLTEDELEAEGLAPPFWAFAWGGGQGLARWVLDHPDAVRGLGVVDFASGSGLVGIAAARAGAATVTCCEIDPMGEAAIALNAEANGIAPPAVVCGDVIGRSRAAFGMCDLVLVGDVHYDRGFAERVTPWLEALAAGGCRVLVGDPGRAYFPHDRNWQCLARYEVATMRALEDSAIRSVGVFEVTPPERCVRAADRAGPRACRAG